MRQKYSLLLSISLSVILLLIPSSRAHAAECSPIATTGTYFQSYDSAEYSPQGLLILHFKTNPSQSRVDRTVIADWIVDNDECGGGNLVNGSTNRNVILPKGFTDFSIRFSSPTHFDIWNDASSTILTCAPLAAGSHGCSRDIPDFPDYYSFRWYGVITIGATTHTILTSDYPIMLDRHPAVAPVSTSTLPTPPVCTPYARTYTGGSPTLFDNYEHPEYVDGLLRVHYRYASPYNSGSLWKARLREHSAGCIPDTDTFPPSSNLASTPYIRYWSLRMTSPTHWEIWNDENNVKEVCPYCQGDIAPATAYISLIGLNGASGNMFRSTPYAPTQAPKNSSVVFIPGIEGSRLYNQGIFLENQLWEPNWTSDVIQLFLDANGKSMDTSIYTKDIIDEVQGVSNIYQSLIDMMDGLVADKSIKEWEAIPYDWRLDYSDTVNFDINIADTLTLNLENRLEQIASRSNTGKVTIIAHSQGGLIAKLLINKLKADGKEQLVDKLVLVAVPQSGTPKAVAGLLHGEVDPGFIAEHFILTKPLVKQLAEHSLSAIELLPSPAYFAKVAEPVIEFATTTTLTSAWRAKYGNTIDTPAELNNFLIGGDGRTKPAADDIDHPNVLLANLLSKASSTGAILDSWQAPSNIKVTQIVGWGLDTLTGIKYTERIGTLCNKDVSVCLDNQKILDHRPLTKTDGDGTVISYSADKLNVETYYVNLRNYNADQLPIIGVSRDHGDITEVENIRDIISKLVTGSSIGLEKYVTLTKPTDPILENRLSVHSPVTLDIYDSIGRHTGKVTRSSGDLQGLDEQIPNSSYMEVGEGKYVSLPAGSDFNVVMRGLGTGTFTLESESGVGGNYAGGPVYGDIPVDADSIAKVTLSSAGTLSPLSLDIDGNGTADVTVAQGEEISASSLLDILEYQINKLENPKQVKKWDKKVEKVRKSLTKQKVDNAQKRLDTLVKLIQKSISKGKIDLVSANNLMRLITQVKSKIS